MAPDIDETVSERDGLAWAEELTQFADVVIVVPKSILPTDVPERFRVGMPCQPRFGPTPWQWPQYRHCSSVHLLGGSPVTYREILKYGVPVESVDTVAPLRAAQFGSFWNGERWDELDGENGYYEAVRRSYTGIKETVNEDRQWRFDPTPRQDWWGSRRLREWHPDADCWRAEEPIPRFRGRYE